MAQIRFKTQLLQGSFLLKTLDDLMLPGFALEDPKFYCPGEGREALLRFFFGKTQSASLAEPVVDFLNALDRGDVSHGELEEALEEMAAYFALAWPEPLGSYGPQAAGAVKALPPEKRDRAYAHLMVYSWMFRMPYPSFPPEVRQALLSGWQSKPVRQEPEPVILWEDQVLAPEGTHFRLSWKNLPKKPLRRVRLMNPHSHKVWVELKTVLGRRRIWVRPGACLNTLFVGDVMTCIKGSISYRENIAWAFGGSSLLRLDLNMKTCNQVDLPGQPPEDVTAGSYGALMLVRGDTLFMPDRQRISNALLVFGSENHWVSLGANGRTQSDDPGLCRSGICALVNTGKELYLVSRDDPEESRLVDKMLDRFPAKEGDTAELMQWNGRQIRLTMDGRLIV